MPVLKPSNRLVLRELYEFRCGYCQLTEIDIGGELTEDHFHPLSQGGSNNLENIVYACHICNIFKGALWDPTSEERILHLLNDNVAFHIAEDETGRLIPQTVTGAFHIEQLRLNRPGLVAHRLKLINNRVRYERMDSIEEELRLLRTMIQVLLDRQPPHD